MEPWNSVARPQEGYHQPLRQQPHALAGSFEPGTFALAGSLEPGTHAGVAAQLPVAGWLHGAGAWLPQVMVWCAWHGVVPYATAPDLHGSSTSGACWSSMYVSCCVAQEEASAQL
jgi:hypothetical protein